MTESLVPPRARVRVVAPARAEAPAAVRIVGLAPDAAERLAGAIRARLGVPAAAADPDHLGPTDTVLTTAGNAPAVLAAVDPTRVGVLWGRQAPSARAREWEAAGATLIPGPLPSAAVAWCAARIPEAGGADALEWEAEPDAFDAFDAPAEAFEWEDDAEPARPAVDPAPPPRRPARGRAPAAGPRARGVSVAVYSCGGGVGKTTTAVYLATLASQRAIRTGIVELDENRGALLATWDLAPRGGGIDSLPPEVWEDPGRLAERLAQTVVPVGPRLGVLPITGTLDGLQFPKESLEAARAALGHLYAWAGQQWDLVFYDLSFNLRDEAALFTLAAADRVLFVLTPEARTYQAALRTLDILEQLGRDGTAALQKMALVVNKVERPRTARLSPREMARELGLPLAGEIAANGPKYNREINQHRLVVTPEWERLWEALALPVAGHPGAAARPDARPSLARRLLGFGPRRR